MDKNIRIKAVLDPSGIDSQIQQIQQKLKTLQKDTEMFKGGGTLSNRSAQYAQKTFETSSRQIMEREKVQLEEFSRKEMQALSHKKISLRELEKMEGNLNDKQKERVKLLQDEINLRSRNVLSANQTLQGLNQSLNPQTTPPPPAPTMLQNLMSRVNPRNLAAMAAGSSQVLNMYTDAKGYQKTRDRDFLSSQANQTQSANIQFQDTLSGRGYRSAFEGKERSTALQMALKERESRLALDPLKAAGSALLQGGIGGAIGGMAGGPVAAGIGGALGAGNAIFGNRGVYDMLFDQKKYQSSVNQETFSNFQSNLQALKLADPSKFAAENMFNKNASNMQTLSRRLGLSDAEMLGTKSSTAASEAPVRRGNYRATGVEGREYTFSESKEEFAERTQAYNQQMMQRDQQRQQNRTQGVFESNMRDSNGDVAFSQERIQQMMSTMLSAGGSSDFIRNQRGAGTAAEYERAGFTNAGKELGILSGQSNTPEQAYIRLIAEGMKLGINQSSLPEETRRFTQIAVGLMQSTQGAEGAVRVFGSGMVGTNQASMQGAQSAFERINSDAGQATGYRGALKQSYLQSQEGQSKFGMLDYNMQQALTEMDVKSLDPDNPMIQRYADEAGISPEEAISNIRGMQEQSENLSPQADNARTSLREGYSSFRGDKKDSADLRQEYFGGKQGRKELTNYLAARGVERSGEGALGKETMESLGGFALGTDFQGLTAESDLNIKKAPSGRSADVREASQANDQLAQLQVLNNKIDDLVKAMLDSSKASTDSKTAIIINTEALKEVTEAYKTDKTSGESMFEGLMQTIQQPTVRR